MNLVWAALIITVVTAISVVLMLIVRRGAPDGSYFADGDRASGVFGVLATGFSVLLGFIVFLAFTSYDSSRAGAESESVIVAQQIETAQLFDSSVKDELTGELLCYGRSVAGEEWDRMEKGTLGDTINPWSAEMFRTVAKVDPQTATQQSAYDKWLDQTSDREQARNDRVHAAAGVIPVPLWLVLFFVSVVIVFYMLFFADRGERALVQAVLMGSVVAVICTLLLLLAFLNSPYQSGVGGLRPTAMERILRISDDELTAAHANVTPPCRPDGERL